MKKICLHLTIALLMSFCQCATSRVTGSWKGTDIHPDTYKNILVLSIIHGPDSSLQKMMEEHLAKLLTARGCSAFSANIKYGRHPFASMPNDSIKKILLQDAIDIVLTIVLRDKSRELYDITGKVLFSLYPFREDDFWIYYSAMNDYHSFYTSYQEHTAWFWESNVYDVNSGTLVYSIQTTSFDPFSMEDLSRGYAHILVKNMIRNNVLKPNK